MKDSAPAEWYLVSSSPHAHSGATIQRIMLDVLIALAPALVASVIFYGFNAIRLVVACVVASVACEWLCRLVMRRENTLSDLSAAVTGVLLAFNLPPELPTSMAILGSVVAIGIAKQVFGGLGYNPFNPALIGRAFLLISFTGAMTQWTPSILDATTTATPLGMVKEALKACEPLPFGMNVPVTLDFFLGRMNGCLGETSALALLLGGVYLLIRRVITWHVPITYLATVAVYAIVLQLSGAAYAMPAHFHLLTGGLMLGAWFMATDMVTSPVSRKGQIIFGVGCGLLTMVLRTVVKGDYPEGVSFAILIMNAMTPLINRATRSRVFGQRRKAS